MARGHLDRHGYSCIAAGMIGLSKLTSSSSAGIRPALLITDDYTCPIRLLRLSRVTDTHVCVHLCGSSVCLTEGAVDQRMFCDMRRRKKSMCDNFDAARQNFDACRFTHRTFSGGITTCVRCRAWAGAAAKFILAELGTARPGSSRTVIQHVRVQSLSLSADS